MATDSCKEALRAFKKFKRLVENGSDNKLKTLCTDRGGEFLSQNFSKFREEEDIKRQLTKDALKHSWYHYEYTNQDPHKEKHLPFVTIHSTKKCCGRTKKSHHNEHCKKLTQENASPGDFLGRGNMTCSLSSKSFTNKGVGHL